MTNGPLASAALVALPDGQPAAVAQPTAEQTARFEQQLQLPASANPAYYQIPPPETAGVAGSWHLVMHDVGQMAEQFRADAAALDREPADLDSTSGGPRRNADPQAASQNFLKGMTQLSHMSYTMLNISFITTTERLAGENVRSLYQLG
jgi:hypothetical protein